MPQVPTYDSQETNRPVGGGFSAPATLERGTDAVSQGLQQAYMVSQQRKREQDESDAHLWTANSLSTFRQQVLSNYETSKDTVAPGADNFAGEQNKYLETELSAALKQAPSPRARNLFEMRAREFQGSFFQHALSFEASEKQRNRLQSQIDGAKSESNELYNAVDPLRAWNLFVPQRLELLAQMPADPGAKKQAQELAAQHFSKTVVLADSQRDPSIALSRIDDGTYSKLPGWNLFGDQLDSLRAHVKAMVDHKEANQAGEIRYELKNWEAAVLHGESDRPFPFSAEQINKSLSPHEARETINKLNNLKHIVSVTKDMSALPTTEVRKAAEKIAVDTQAGKYPAAWGYSVADSALEHANKLLALRSTDPAAAADLATMEYDKAQAAIGAPQTLHDRVAQRWAVQVHQFKTPPRYVRLLTTDEAKAKASQVEGAQSVDEAQQLLADFEKEGSANTAGVQNEREVGLSAKDLQRQMVSEIYRYGGLSPKHMFVAFGKDTIYGNELYVAASLKNDTNLKASLGRDRVKGIADAIASNATINQFVHLTALQSGDNMPEAPGYLRQLLESTAMVIASKDLNASGPEVVERLAKVLVDDQIALKGTYYIPRKDVNTGTEYDTDRLGTILEKAKSTWMQADGKRFVPDVRSRALQSIGGIDPEKVMASDPESFAWVNKPDGSGVYLALRMRGMANWYGSTSPAGVYEPIPDAQGRLYEINFRDAEWIRSEMSRVEGLKRNPKRQQTGRIR